MKLRTKISLASSALLLFLGGALLAFHDRQERESFQQRYLDKARSILLTIEATRESMARKWDLGIFTPEQVSEWAAEGELDLVLATVPVVTAWEAAMEKASSGDYEFRVPKFQPRNPANEPDELEARALRMLERTAAAEYWEIDESTNAVRYFRPIRLTSECLLCHGDPATSMALWGNDRGLDPTGARMEGWKVGELHGAFEVIQGLDGADAARLSLLWKGGAAVLLLLATSVGLLYWMLSRSVLGPIDSMLAVTKKVAAGDLTGQVEISETGELGELGQSFNEMVGALDEVVGQITTAGDSMRSTSLAQMDGARTQSDATQEMSTTVTELLHSAKEMARNGAHVSEQASLAAEECRTGRSGIQEAVEGIRGIHQRVEKIATHMLDLSGKSQQIAGVLDIISELSEQTNLLSLNASIEAAGAGEAGKRFAVVANEVRKLADRAGQSTTEIRSLIEGIQETVNTTIMATEEGAKAVHEGVRLSEEADRAFSSIADQVAATAESAKTIEIGCRQQATAIEQMEVAVRNIDAAAQETESIARKVETEAQFLLDSASSLRGSATKATSPA